MVGNFRLLVWCLWESLHQHINHMIIDILICKIFLLRKCQSGGGLGQINLLLLQSPALFYNMDMTSFKKLTTLLPLALLLAGYTAFSHPWLANIFSCFVLDHSQQFHNFQIFVFQSLLQSKCSLPLKDLIPHLLPLTILFHNKGGWSLWYHR